MNSTYVHVQLWVYILCNIVYTVSIYTQYNVQCTVKYTARCTLARAPHLERVPATNVVAVPRRVFDGVGVRAEDLDRPRRTVVELDHTLYLREGHVVAVLELVADSSRRLDPRAILAQHALA